MLYLDCIFSRPQGDEIGRISKYGVTIFLLQFSVCSHQRQLLAAENHWYSESPVQRTTAANCGVRSEPSESEGI